MSALDFLLAKDFLSNAAGLIPKLDLKTHSKPWSEHCQMAANNDVEAVIKWLEEYNYKKNTYVAYKREALRFLIWCSYQQGKSLVELKKEDLEAYFLFLKSPPDHWCGEKRTHHSAKIWRPFRGSLSRSAFMTAIRILSSLFNYLVQAEYLRANPIKLIKKYTKLTFDSEERKEKVWERILERDEWEAVENALIEMPEKSAFEVYNKMRTQFLFAVLYLFGLRIHEVANHTWGNFSQRRTGQWWFSVKGKGDKTRRVSVNDQLLEFIKAYRTYLKKPALPEPGETENLFISQRTKRPLKITQLYSLVKAMGEAAAKAFPEQPQKQEKLRKFSPHWLRHLSATHQDQLGFSVATIMKNLGHSSRETVQIYVHAEDDERFQQMQKMKMRVEPKLIQQNKKVVGIVYKLQLTKGPVNKAMGLSRVLVGIEQLFKGLEWTLVNGPKEILLERIKGQGIESGAIELAYQVKNQEEIEDTKMWAEALKRQCEIWLFAIEIQILEMKENHG